MWDKGTLRAGLELLLRQGLGHTRHCFLEFEGLHILNLDSVITRSGGFQTFKI